MKKTFFKYIAAAILLATFYACSNKTSIPIIDEDAPTCDDGILNGDEIAIDCGGDCPGFCPESSIGILRGELVTILTL